MNLTTKAMKFYQVAHLYVGCKLEWGYIYIDFTANKLYDIDLFGLKPALFPLSAMTEEQKKEHKKLLELLFIAEEETVRGETPESFKYLLDNHFDLYNLIEQGEAIDVTTLKVNPYKS